MTACVHYGDLPKELSFGNSIAVDTEAMGLIHRRDRLCLVQISSGDGHSHLVKFSADDKKYDAPNLKSVLSDESITKIFHFARFDIGIIRYHLKVWVEPCYCTKIASRLVRTYTDNHGLKDLCNELLGIRINKLQQSSDWGREQLTPEQQDYAASDVLHLHKIKEKLDVMLKREGREELAYDCFRFLKTRVELDLLGWDNVDIFSHQTSATKW